MDGKTGYKTVMQIKKILRFVTMILSLFLNVFIIIWSKHNSLSTEMKKNALQAVFFSTKHTIEVPFCSESKAHTGMPHI